MCKYIVKGESGESKVEVGEYHELFRSLDLPKDAIYITDSNIVRIYKDFLENKQVIVVAAGDKNKNLTTMDYIYEQLIGFGADRKSFIIGFGGGMITDIAGFAASTYMRGIRFGFISTSLLGIVDASVGGKNGVNHNSFKNMIGNFNQPEFVIIDSVFLKTLPQDEFINGMAEAIKHYLIADENGFEKYEKNVIKFLENRYYDLNDFLCEQVKIKIDVVNKDEKESGERKKLNFGHTFGHAIEKLTGMKHGFAISIGMVVAAKISVKLDLLSEEDLERIKTTLKSTGLPIDCDKSKPQIIDAMHKDKKKDGDKIHFVALKRIGKAKVIKMKLEELEKLFLEE